MENNNSQENGEPVDKAKCYDDMKQHIERLITYRDGLISHYTSCQKQVVMKDGDSRDERFTGNYTVKTSMIKISEEETRDILDEITKMNIIIDAFSNFFPANS